jgi:hypothetical protein
VRRAFAIVAAALVAAPAAGAESVRSAQLRVLAVQAASDPAALSRLRDVDRVDGRAVDLRAALAGASGAALRARLRVLAGTPAGATVTTGSPRDDARRILAERKYRGTPVPRPFHGILEWLSKKFDFVRRAFRWVSDHVGGSRVVWVFLAAATVALAALAAARLARRRAARALAGAGAVIGSIRDDPRDLDRRAADAEREGDLELALRLRFRAGLLRLGRARVVPLRPSLTSGEVRRTLGLEEFDRLAHDFDEVVYGRRPAAAQHVRTARETWPRVLAKAGER